MKTKEILSLISDDLLSELAIETNVDYYARKLQGEVIFKLLLYCIITQKNNSLRTMESAYEKAAFQLLNQRYNRGTVKFNSISERLLNINVDFFEKLFTNCVDSYKKLLENHKKSIVRFD